MTENFASVDAYLDSFPEDVRLVLAQVRAAMHRAAPGAGERISYKIPTLTLNGRALAYFAGWTAHVSVYPVPSGDGEFSAAIAPYQAGKGTLRFPLDTPVPYDLVERLVTLLVSQHANRERRD